MNHLIIVDRENAKSSSVKEELKQTKYLNLDIIDIKLEYFKLHKDEINEKVLTLEEIELVKNSEPNFKFNPDEKYLVLGQECWKYIRYMIHFGPRGEGFYDISRMNYIRTRNGSIFKFIYLNYRQESKWLTAENYNIFENNFELLKKKIKNPHLFTGTSKKTNKPYYLLKYDAIQDMNEFVQQFLDRDIESFKVNYPITKHFARTSSEFIPFFNELERELANGNYFGLDYETSGFPFDDPEFYHMGVAISTVTGNSFYFDLDYIQRSGEFEIFKQYYKSFLDKNPCCVTYNQSFEMRATYLIFNKLYFNLEEGSTINKLDGLVSKNYSLKYTAMKNLKVASWDDDFEYLNENLDKMFTDYTLENYKESDIWKEIEKTYPNDLEEFENLFGLYYGDSFKCIPYRILGDYCQLDAYYTSLLKKIALERYKDPRAWSCYNNNLTLGALLGIFGADVDFGEMKSMSKIAYELLIYGNIINAINYSKYKLSLYKDFVPPKLDDYVINCFSAGVYPLESKAILWKCYDPNVEFGLVEDNMVKYFNPEIIPQLTKIIKDYGGLIDGWRRRSIFSDLDALIRTKLNIKEEGNKLLVEINGVTTEYEMKISDLVDYFNYQNFLNQLYELADSFRDHKPYYINFKKATNWEVIDYCKGIVNVMSSGEGELIDALFELNKDIIYEALCSDLSFDAVNKEVTEIPEYKLFDNVKDDYYRSKWNDYFKLEQSAEKFVNTTILKDYLANSTYQQRHSSLRLFIKSIVTSGFGVIKKDFDKEVAEITNEMLRTSISKMWDEDIDYTKGDFMIKNASPAENLINLKRACTFMNLKFDEAVDSLCFSAQYMLDYKDADCKSVYSYIETIYRDYHNFKNNYISYIINYNLYKASKKYYKILTTYIEGQFTSYNRGVNADNEELISTERFYNPQKAEHIKMYSSFNVNEKKSKRWSASMHTVPSKSEVKRLLVAPEGYLLSYFDISGAEVRAISYIAKDEYMLDCYSKNIDPYINLAKFLQPGKDDAFYKDIRSVYKTILLGSLYGMGIATLAERSGISYDEAEKKHRDMFAKMSGIAKLSKEKGEYCRNHNGLVESYLGDVLEMDRSDSDRLERLGVNQFIQNIAAVSLADGFYNNIKVSYLDRTQPFAVPVNVVHDSSQNYFRIKDLFEMDKFYHRNLTDYLYDKYGIKYEFDLEIGANYYDMCDLKTISDTRLQLKGNSVSLMKLMNRLENQDELKYEIVKILDKKHDKELSSLSEVVPSHKYEPFIQFLFATGDIASFNRDFSSYSIELVKL